MAGFGAAILYPISLAMLAAASPSQEARSKAIAVWAGFLSIGAAISPLMGGWLAEQGDWRASYLVVVAAAVVSIVITRFAADSSAPEGRKLDVPGQVTLALGLIAILFAATQGSEAGFARPEIVGAFVLGVALLGAFVVIELRTEVPLLHLGIFANRSYAVVAIATVVGMFAFLATCYSMSIWLGAIQHQSALKIGVLFLFIQGPAFVLVPIVSHLIRNFSPRWVLTAGFSLIAVSGVWCSTFDVHDMDWTRFIAPMLALGVGFALTVGSITAVAINTVPLRLARHGQRHHQPAPRLRLRPRPGAHRRVRGQPGEQRHERRFRRGTRRVRPPAAVHRRRRRDRERERRHGDQLDAGRARRRSGHAAGADAREPAHARARVARQRLQPRVPGRRPLRRRRRGSDAVRALRLEARRRPAQYEWIGKFT
ncbi:MFS transporter [Nonomuraea ferruginea]